MGSYFYWPKASPYRKGSPPGMEHFDNCPQPGETMIFVPSVLISNTAGTNLDTFGVPEEDQRVEGVCVYVNREKRFARYRYETPRGGEAFECFKF